MKFVNIVPVFLLFFIACSENASGPLDQNSLLDQQTTWKAETLQPEMTIAFPGVYEGDGFWCGFDACYFEKSRTDGSVQFSFALGPMTGNDPAEFDELPDLFCYPHRELITTDEGLKGALYYALESENPCVKSVGTFLIAKRDLSGYHQVIGVIYDHSQHAHVCDLLRTIKYVSE